MANNYQRLFYIFKNMDSDVGYPTGYIRVEINCEAAKMQISLNNLLNKQGLIYQLYGIKKDDKQLIYTVICDVPNVNGRADVKINTDIHKIGSNKLSIGDINIFAIITQLPDRVPSVKCPLVAYTKNELTWKKEFETLLLNKDWSVSNDNVAKSEIVDNTKEDIADKVAVENIGVENTRTMFTADELNNLNELNETEQIPDTLAEIVPLEDINDEAEVLEDMQNDETEVLKDKRTEDAGIFECQDQFGQEMDVREDISVQNATENFPNDKKFDIASKFESVLTSIYNTEKSPESEQKIMPELNPADNDILGCAQKNFKDILSIDIDGNTRKNELNMPGLKDELDKSFESYNPFKIKSKSFKWWKINSPGYLNNILFRNNVKTYLLFNPKVMLAHYKYRYIIFGIRNDKHSNKEYFVCGVPGVYSIDENPFGSMGSWTQLEGYKPKYGAFGYWIILIDPRTGKLVKIK